MVKAWKGLSGNCMGKFFTSRKLKRRWLSALHGQGIAANSTTLTAGTVYLSLIEILETVTIDQIVWINGATVAGNVRVGIYGPVPTEETSNAAPVLYDSGDIAQSGTSAPQTHTLSTPKTLAPGRYYLALEVSDATATVLRHANNAQVTGWLQAYARGGGYGALTDPAPAPSSTTICPSLRLRCIV
jgi:hypothetical protein